VDIVVCLATALAAYLLGSIPTGYLVGRAKGVDVRKAGSGNIGATNVFRLLGKPAGVLVLVADGMKGWLAVSMAPLLAYRLFEASTPLDASAHEYLELIAGALVILGHNYTCWLKFKGGKGIATTAGVLAALVPLTFAACLLTWIVFCLLTRYVSVASIMAAVALPVSTCVVYHFTHNEDYGLRMIILAAVLAALAIYKHKGNLERLMNGTESKIGQKSQPANGAPPP
jgi:acyl phosphate:glycerol-3-phosphate acyltransferase